MYLFKRVLITEERQIFALTVLVLIHGFFLVVTKTGLAHKKSSEFQSAREVRIKDYRSLTNQASWL